MVELHGGSISLESKVGQGSRFIVSMPLLRDWTQERGRRRRAGAEGQGSGGAEGQGDCAVAGSNAPLVLLVEDNEMNIPMIQNCLEAHGYRVAIARNGLEALQRIKSRCPDLVLMDIQMPEMNGIEATRQIRAETSLAQLPIIALTSLVMPGDREKCLAAGMNDFLAKPLSLRRLTRAIAQYLAQKHPSISTMQ